MPSYPIGLSQVPISVSAKTPAIRKKVLARLDVMQRELERVQMSIAALRHALAAPQPSSRPIADAIMNSRNWSLSVAMSHAWIHSMLSTFYKPGVAVAGNYLPRLQFNDDNLPELFVRAVEMETQKAHADPDFGDEWRQSNPNYQFPRIPDNPKTFGP